MTGSNDHDDTLADVLAAALDSDAETIRREADAVDLPPPWEGDVSESAGE